MRWGSTPILLNACTCQGHRSCRLRQQLASGPNPRKRPQPRWRGCRRDPACRDEPDAGPLRWFAARALVESPERDNWTRRPRSPKPVTLPRVFLQDPKPHERVRLKHVGGRVEGQTVKVVRNDEGGATRGWKPATGNPEQLETDSSRFPRESAVDEPGGPNGALAGLPADAARGSSRERHGSRPHRPTR